MQSMAIQEHCCLKMPLHAKPIQAQSRKRTPGAYFCWFLSSTGWCLLCLIANNRKKASPQIHEVPPAGLVELTNVLCIQELIAEEAANRKDIEDVIEEERAKVDAKTQITQDVFLQWRQKNKDSKQSEADAAEAERKKKGVMTGREIFAQVILPSPWQPILGRPNFSADAVFPP